MIICKTCDKMSKMCAEFKKKCLAADYNSKLYSSERFLWSENLKELKTDQQEQEIETIMETPLHIPEASIPIEAVAEDIPPNIQFNEDLIDNLTNDQLKELTKEITKLMSIDLQEEEQFTFIATRSARKSTTTITRTKTPSINNSGQVFSCNKCNSVFPDAQMLSLHFARMHIYKTKRNSL